jgi:NAD+ synthase (glutamine-hydrolysing)
MDYGYMKVATGVPVVKVADCAFNVQQIETIIAQAEGKGAEVICFPELCITGYTCQDLFTQQVLLDEAETGLLKILDFTRTFDIISIVGLPVPVGGLLLNCAAVVQKGNILGLISKTYLPNYKEFYEKRWFASSCDITDTDIRFAGKTVRMTSGQTLFRTGNGVNFGVEICEDVWAVTPPSSKLALAGAEIIFNLSASNELIGKHTYLMSLLSQQSARTMSAYVYSCCGFGESSQDVVYCGNAFIYENGTLVVQSERFSFKQQLVIGQVDIERLRTERRINSTFAASQKGVCADVVVEAKPITPDDFELLRYIDPHPFVPKGTELDERCKEIFNIQIAGLAKRINHTQSENVVVGISGGLDSTLALLVCAKTFDKLGIPRSGIIGVTMPGFGTTDRTYNNAVSLMRSLGITIKDISIRDACIQHFKDINHNPDIHDIAYENSQARERTQILMDVANQIGCFVVGTGDLSELALGWATYNGDHMSMYGVNSGIPKTLVQHLVKWVAECMVDELSRATLLDIINTPISPELIPATSDGEIKQKTEDLVGPYELHDFFLYYFLRFGFRPSKIYLLAKKAFGSNLPDTGMYDQDVIKKWLTVFCRRFFAQQFKRSCLPDGPKVGSCSLSPRGDWRMPSDASSTSWIEECDNL